MTEESLEHLPPSGRKSPRSVLHLKTNNLFDAFHVPGEMIGLDQERYRRVDATGTWRIMTFDGNTQVELAFTAVHGAPEASVPYGQPLEISGFRSPKSLYYYVEDPDQGKIVEFIRGSPGVGR